MVPEINLTPQLEGGLEHALLRWVLFPCTVSWLRRRVNVTVLHLPERQRLCWGRAYRSLRPCKLGLILIDEEHDASFQTAGRDALFGARYCRISGTSLRAFLFCLARRRRRSKVGRMPKISYHQKTKFV